MRSILHHLPLLLIVIIMCISFTTASQWEIMSFYTDSNCSGTAVYIGAGPTPAYASCTPISCSPVSYMAGFISVVCEDTSVAPIPASGAFGTIHYTNSDCSEIAFFDYFPTNTCLSYGQFVNTIFTCNGNSNNTGTQERFSDSQCSKIQSSYPLPVMVCNPSLAASTFCI